MIKHINLVNLLTSLRGSKVKIFGQDATLPKNVDEFSIDILTILENLKNYAFLVQGDEQDFIDEIKQTHTEYFLENTYNFCAPLSNHFIYEVYESKDKEDEDAGVYVAIRVHLYGDARTNYTDRVWYKFDYIEQFFEQLYYASKDVEVIVNDKPYYARLIWNSDEYEIYDDSQDIVAYASGDKDDVIECIQEALDRSQA